jgi:threonine dehydrogenase-like Zn-dependent dehydrogenase
VTPVAELSALLLLQVNRVTVMALAVNQGEPAMPETGLLLAMTGPRQPFVPREYPVPEPGPGAVLVKVTLANICGSDLHIWRGDYKLGDTGGPILRIIGHEMAGVVARLGDGVTTDTAGQPLHVGDRVVYRYFYPCGRCRACLRRRTPRCPYAMRHRHPPDVWPHFNAAYGQYYYLHPGHTIFKVPDNVTDEMAGPANCALSQVIYGLEQARAGLGDHVVIQGAGGLGINAIAVAKEMGVAQVIVIDGLDDRLQLAREFGADQLIDLRQFPTPESRVQRVKALTDGWGADVVLEVAGQARVVPEGILMLGNGGTYVEIGNICQGPACALDPSDLVLYGRTILGVMWYEADSLLKAVRFLSTHQDRYPFRKLLSHKYPLRDINTAFAEQDAGKVHRSALLPWA